MSDLISREALRNVILNDRKLDGVNANWEVNRILVHIDNAPTVENEESIYGDGYQDGHKDGYDKGYDDAQAKFERPKGEWLKVTDKYGENVKCPFCGKEIAGSDLNYCVKCGAKMEV